MIDHLALLRFKEFITNDPFDFLASWNSSTHFCKWPGITCSCRHPQRITSLILDGYLLHGSISPHVGNLSFLRILRLQHNNFYGLIPQELARLFRLQELMLTKNTLAGAIPSNITSGTKLRRLSFQRNNLIGKIPMEIFSLHELQEVYLDLNNLTGQFPAFIWNISSLIYLSAAYNNLEGNIPKEIGHLSLQKFAIPINQLSDMLPSSLYNMSSLNMLSISGSKFNGSLPANMFLSLPSMEDFEIHTNQFSSLILISIANASNLQTIEMGKNRFVGQVPNLQMLPNLWWINVGLNNLGKNSSHDCDFLISLMNCTKLEMDDNNFEGSLPESMGNFSNQLIQLYLDGNQISGNIPPTLGNLLNLNLLTMERNRFTDKIPDTLGRLQKLGKLTLWGNKLSGLTTVSIGPIPTQVISFSSLSILLNLSCNSLSGSLPTEVGQLKNIDILDVSENDLSGDNPDTIGDSRSLEYLNLRGNSFQGNIYSSLTLLKGLRYLDLLRNNLSGLIPEGLQNIFGLEYLNVSFNMLEGKVPTYGVFQNASASLVAGNDKLCGGISKLYLPLCPHQLDTNRKHDSLIQMKVIMSVVDSILLLSFLVIYEIRRIRKSSFISQTIDSKVSYQSLYHATNDFSTSNLIGSGSYGLVYKGRLDFEENIVAIKVLNLQRKEVDKNFIIECNALRNIRHRNLVKIVTCCSSTDHRKNEFKALVFEYMENGSLEDWLHPKTKRACQHRILNLDQRLNILIDITSTLHCLHYECVKPIIHCDFDMLQFWARDWHRKSLSSDFPQA